MVMKGDKGSSDKLETPVLWHRMLTSGVVEFSGTLLGFDDYVSEFIRDLSPGGTVD